MKWRKRKGLKMETEYSPRPIGLTESTNEAGKLNKNRRTGRKKKLLDIGQKGGREMSEERKQKENRWIKFVYDENITKKIS